jgi:hypothetical protein
VLTNLFRLDGTPHVVNSDTPLPALRADEVVKDMVFEINPWGVGTGMKNLRFLRVAFSKFIEKVTFTDCKFENCLFIGTRFQEVEFHNCTFKNCNFWKARFSQVYLDPRTIIYERRFETDAANAGISLYQALLSNFAEERQDKFYLIADIHFRRWKRFQIRADLKRKRLGWWTARFQQFTSWLYDICVGYGYSPVSFFITTVVLFLSVSLINYYAIGNAVSINNASPGTTSFVDAIFYTFSILTVLGFSTIVPATPAAKLLSVSEALLAVCWLGMLTSVLVKRFLR